MAAIASGRGTQPSWRADLDGVRAIAIVAVVLFHAGVLQPGFFGFVGVDVFFVVSGFLITGQLVRELEATDTVDLPAFWARRIRRLLPAATVMMVTVALASLVVGSAVEWRRIGTDLLATSLGAANVRFGMVASDYFRADVTTSPVLQMWSLGVEEQFYVAWPVVLLATLALARWFSRRRGATSPISARRVVLTTATLAALASMGLWWWLSTTESPWAFYAMPARAWQLAAGAVVAMGFSTRHVVGRAAGAGMVAVAMAGGWLGVDRPMSMVLATVGTALLVSSSSSSSFGLGNAALGWVGQRSYGWYLWHWPCLALLTLTVSQTTPFQRAIAVAGSLVLAAASFRWVEQPLRRGPWLRGRRRPWGALLAVIGLMGAVWLGLVLLRKQAFRDSPELARLAVAQKDFSPMPNCRTLDEAMTSPACLVGGADGDVDAVPTVLVVGDSHAWMWVPAIVEAGKQAGWAVRFAGMPSCPATVLAEAEGGRLPKSCRALQASLLSTTTTTTAPAPAMVVLVSYGLFRSEMFAAHVDEGRAGQLWQEGLGRMLNRFADVPRMVLLDGPRFPHDPLYCLARPWTSCDVSVDVGLAPVRWSRDAERRAAAAVPGTVVVDPSLVLCLAGVCPARMGDVFPFADNNHVSRAGARLLVPRLAETFAAARP